MDTPTTPAEVVQLWDRGETLWSVEMGGIGPGYEQAIQVLIVELLRDHGGEPLPADDDHRWGDDTVSRTNKQCGGYSGAQVGAAKSIAYRIIRDGYQEFLRAAREQVPDRMIQISNVWPKAAPASGEEPRP